MEMTKRITEEEVRAIQEPEFTKSWHPVSHAKVIDATGAALDRIGLRVINKQYSVIRDGGNMFATWVLDEKSNGAHWSLGFRNSLVKTFAVGFCCGTHVIVCSNMMFSGEFIEFRKHTSGLDFDELTRVTDNTVKQVVSKNKELAEWQIDLKRYYVTGNNFKMLTYDALDKNIIAPSQFKNFHVSHEKEIELNGNSLYSFHGAVTRTLRDQTLFTIAGRSKKLIETCNEYKTEFLNAA